jgi:hypothetical protein
MTRIRARGEDVRRYIVEQVDKHPSAISKRTAEHFGITRQAVNKHLQKLTAEGALTNTGNTRSRIYKLCPLKEWAALYAITPELAEDVIWRSDISPNLGHMPDNVLDIWHYGFTEMFNNAIDHSEGTQIYVSIKKTAATTEMSIMDNGVGIFRKIRTAMNLLDERHAVLELAKGKLTTDPKRHTGEGIFFSSRMFDEFDILAGGVHFSHRFGDARDWIWERAKPGFQTFVAMKLNNHTARTTRKIFDQYTSAEDFRFNKTVVPAELAQYGDDKLISRSQAKRLLARVELFKIVVFDFTRVSAIGQAFADEIFRVFPMKHPEIELAVVHVNSEVKRMIERAKSGGVKDNGSV